MTIPPPPDPNNPRDLRNRPAYRRMKERLRRQREEKLTLAEPVQAHLQEQEQEKDDGAVPVLAVDPGDGQYNDDRNARGSS